MLHKNISPSDNHAVYTWAYANAAARTSATGFVASDIGKVAWQQSDDTFWVLKATTPAWVPLAAGTGGGTTPDLDAIFCDGTEIATFNINGSFSFSGGAHQKSVAVAATTISLSAGNFFTKTITGATTFSVSNVPSTGSAGVIILELVNGGSATVTLWSGIKWKGGTPPTLTAAGKDVLGFYTLDGGTSWVGFANLDVK